MAVNIRGGSGTTAQLPELGPGCRILHVSVQQRPFTDCRPLDGSGHQNFVVQHPLLPEQTVADGKYVRPHLSVFFF
jgi:hypothetical protein